MFIHYVTQKNEPEEFSGWVKTFLNATAEMTLPDKSQPFYDLAQGLVDQGIKSVADNDTYEYYEAVYDCLDLLILTFVKEHKLGLEDTLVQLHKTLVAKNIDYGNSFDDVVDMMGLPGAVIRVMDKANRLKSLRTIDNNVNESITDTELDFIGYLLLTLHYYQDKETV